MNASVQILIPDNSLPKLGLNGAKSATGPGKGKSSMGILSRNMTPSLQQAHQVFLPGETTREERRGASGQRRRRGLHLDRILHYGYPLGWSNTLQGGGDARCLRHEKSCLSKQSDSEMTEPRSLEIPDLTQFPADSRKGEKRSAMEQRADSRNGRGGHKLNR